MFSAFCLKLNFSKGKTEAIVIFRGIGSQKARICLAQMNNVVLRSCNITNTFLIFVKSYKHMGTIFSPDHQHVEETAARCAYVNAGIRKFYHVLSSPCTPFHRKIMLVKAYLFSGGVL